MKNKARKKNKSNKKNISRFGRLYIAACITSLVIGLGAFGLSLKVSHSAFDTKERSVTIPSPESILKPYESFLPKRTLEPLETSTPTNKPNKAQSTEKPATSEEAVSVMGGQSSMEDLFIEMPITGDILKKFSPDKPLKSKTMGDWRVHKGIDIKSSLGANVNAAADGVVTSIYDDGFLGVTIVIAHGDVFKTIYSNMAGGDMVKVGDKVSKGQCIGCVGDSAKGEALDEAHLHFAVTKNDEYVNPSEYIK